MYRVILLMEPSRGIDRGLMLGISRFAELAGPWVFLREALEYLSGTRRGRQVAQLRSWKADGIICSANELKVARALRLPAVLFGTNDQRTQFPRIVTDDSAAGAMAARHLITLGLRNFGYCGFESMRWSRLRGESFQATIAEAKFQADIYQPASSTMWNWSREQPHMLSWLKQLAKPVGIYCANDDLAELVMELCRVEGMRVPDEVAIVGTDDDRYICNFTNPPLSSVAMNGQKAGYEMADLLQQLMSGRVRMSGQIVRVPATRVVARQSTDVLAIEDSDVASALRFIRENSGKLLQVPDVLAATGAARRTLAERFRKTLGRTILEEITRARVDHISRLLLETDQPVAKIAFSLGYPASDHFSRYFKRSTGLTPLEFRRKRKSLA